MPDSYVIDGYNLIHALGMISKQVEPGGLEASRRRLLDFLAGAFGADADRVTIVFDARQSPRGVSRRHSHLGLHVHFAPKDQSADDWIEEVIDNEMRPHSLVVVSNDLRLQSAAKRRGAKAWSHDALLDFLEKREKRKAAPQRDERSGNLSPEELRRWVQEFESLESDPKVKEFFDLDRFD
jgi:predicted RNA-binding protein with PIN domain